MVVIKKYAINMSVQTCVNSSRKCMGESGSETGYRPTLLTSSVHQSRWLYLVELDY